mmetsp:Transcript_91094/g.195333  ORF Transcript_91094/g.195333 Transcript_91094/m.195333 type:complete len:280 (-) Transcript_91094:37-876(-)
MRWDCLCRDQHPERKVSVKALDDELLAGIIQALERGEAMVLLVDCMQDYFLWRRRIASKTRLEALVAAEDMHHGENHDRLQQLGAFPRRLQKRGAEALEKCLAPEAEQRVSIVQALGQHRCAAAAQVNSPQGLEGRELLRRVPEVHELRDRPESAVLESNCVLDGIRGENVGHEIQSLALQLAQDRVVVVAHGHPRQWIFLWRAEGFEHIRSWLVLAFLEKLLVLLHVPPAFRLEGSGHCVDQLLWLVAHDILEYLCNRLRAPRGQVRPVHRWGRAHQR